MAKVALITGGAKGIGRAIGLDLAAAGWDIALCYRTSEREAAETAARITKTGRRAIAERCDVSDPAAAEAFVRKVERSEEHTSELQSRLHLVCRLLLEKKKKKEYDTYKV